MSKLTALVGAQYGSEGKGVVAKHIAMEYDSHVRVGGPNAGHTFVYNKNLYKMQAIPCGWINPNASLVIGAGAVVSPEAIMKDMRQIPEDLVESVFDRLFIDEKATPLLPEHTREEGHTKGDIHKRIGSTGEGVGAARMDRLRRDEERLQLAGKALRLHPQLGSRLTWNTGFLLQKYLEGDKNVLLEGTQGCGLSITHGPWPYVTSHDTNAAQMLADTGLPASRLKETILVMRTMPIRVHGNSGPLRGETTWEDISKRVGKKVEEKTTVTKLVRRIGEWDENLIDEAVRINDPTWVAITFMDYLFPEDTNKTRIEDLSSKSRGFIEYIERRFGVPVGLVGTGFNVEHGWYCIDRR